MDGPTIENMAKDEKEGKDNKEDEKGEKDEKGKDEKGKDPISGVFFGMILILLGAVYMGRTYLPDPDNWFAWFIAGIGVLFLIKALAHSLRPEWKRPVFGDVTAGIVLLAFGVALIVDIEEWWAIIFIALGVILIIRFARRPKASSP